MPSTDAVPSTAATPASAAPDAAAWLRAHRRGTTPAEALAFLDTLAPVGVDDMLGRWHGAGWRTGHPWDGLLEAYGWYGKEFRDADRVRPLLVRDAVGDPDPVPPGVAPVRLISRFPRAARHPATAAAFRLARPLLGGAWSSGRLRLLEQRGTVTAALVYDRVPIIDAFRRVADDVVLGAADIRGQRAPLFFVLRRSGKNAGPRPR